MVRLSYQHRAFYCYVILSVWIFLLVAGKRNLVTADFICISGKGWGGGGMVLLNILIEIKFLEIDVISLTTKFDCCKHARMIVCVYLRQYKSIKYIFCRTYRKLNSSKFNPHILLDIIYCIPCLRRVLYACKTCARRFLVSYLIVNLSNFEMLKYLNPFSTILASFYF